MSHEILKLKPVTNPGLNIDCPTYQASVVLSLSLLHFLLWTPIWKGKREGHSYLERKEKLLYIGLWNIFWKILKVHFKHYLCILITRDEQYIATFKMIFKNNAGILESFFFSLQDRAIVKKRNDKRRNLKVRSSAEKQFVYLTGLCKSQEDQLEA